MNETLLDRVRRYLEAHADAAGIAQTPVPGLTIIRATTVSGLNPGIPHPQACLVLQGCKQVTQGTRTQVFDAGDSLLITADVPTVSQIVRKSPEQPYISLIIDLNPALIAELAMTMEAGPDSAESPVCLEPTDGEVTEAALRLMRLLDRPEAAPVLYEPLVRELHYWLLAGRHGAAIRRLGWPGSHIHRVGRAVAMLRREFAQPLPVEHLAAQADMSPSSFHRNFRRVTLLSPLQFQKQLRLIEARRLMTGEGLSASNAAFKVGYESVSQFNREYRRLFGLPPATDTAQSKAVVGG